MASEESGTTVGVLTSMNPSDTRRSAILDSISERSFLLGSLNRALRPSSFEATSPDISLSNAESLSRSDGKSSPVLSSSPNSMRRWICGSVNPVINSP